MNKLNIAAIGLIGTLALLPATANASPVKPRAAAEKEQAKLEKEAKISMAEAKEIALKQVKDAKIESSELEREHGKLIYSFDMREAGRNDVTEVNIDAMTGKVIAVDHEDAKKEKAEKKAEKKEKH